MSNPLYTPSFSWAGGLLPWQDESSSSDDDEDWGSDTVDSGSESSDEGDGKGASLAVVFLKKWVLFSAYFILSAFFKSVFWLNYSQKMFVTYFLFLALNINNRL